MAADQSSPQAADLSARRVCQLENHARRTGIENDRVSEFNLLSPVAVNVSADDQSRLFGLDRLANRPATPDLAGGVVIDGIEGRGMNDKDATVRASLQEGLGLFFVEVVAPVTEGRDRNTASDAPEVDPIDLAAAAM